MIKEAIASFVMLVLIVFFNPSVVSTLSELISASVQKHLQKNAAHSSLFVPLAHNRSEATNAGLHRGTQQEYFFLTA